jgi:integrase
MGLEWQDIDWKKSVITIGRTSQYTPELGIFTRYGTKNGDASRLVHIPEGTMKILKHYKEHQDKECESYGDGWINSGRVFIKHDGSPMHPDTPYQWFTEFLEKNGLPKITVHQLRHTNVSMMIYEGIDIVTIASEKGHDPYTMLKTYAHVIRKAGIDGAIKLNDRYYHTSLNGNSKA